jgi:hypothetical protein
VYWYWRCPLQLVQGNTAKKDSLHSSSKFHVNDRSESISPSLATNRYLLDELGIIMNFNDHTVGILTLFQCKTERYSTLSSSEALLEVYLSANAPQMLRDEYSRAIKTLDAVYQQFSES